MRPRRASNRVGRSVDPTHFLRRLRRAVGRSVGLADSRIEPSRPERGSVGRSVRPKICFAALRAAGRSVGLYVYSNSYKDHGSPSTGGGGAPPGTHASHHRPEVGPTPGLTHPCPTPRVPTHARPRAPLTAVTVTAPLTRLSLYSSRRHGTRRTSHTVAAIAARVRRVATAANLLCDSVQARV